MTTASAGTSPRIGKSSPALLAFRWSELNGKDRHGNTRAGIGRPADKRASHAFPRLIFGSRSGGDMVDEQDEYEGDFEGIDFSSEDWISADIALKETVELYATVRDGDRSRAERDAVGTLMHRLMAGRLFARSDDWQYSRHHRELNPELAEFIEPHTTIGGPDYVIAPSYWQQLDTAQRALELPEEDRIGLHSAFVDWVAGDIEFMSVLPTAEGISCSMSITAHAYRLCFNRSGLPGAKRVLGNTGGVSPTLPPLLDRRGAPRKYDWEAAICAVLAKANCDPDGLPEGYGAQAKIGKMLSEWFALQPSGEPVASEIGARAAKIVQAIESHRK